jgi:hypothetical protein
MSFLCPRTALEHVGLALREPEEFLERWNDGRATYSWPTWAALALTAIIGTTTYGMTMGILGGSARVVTAGISCTLAAGLAWTIPLPALYVLNSLAGSRLSIGTTFLAALVTTSWGGLALIASIPVNWFLTVAVPHATVVRIVNLLVFAAVGVAMIDVFGRVLARVEPARGRAPAWWLVLVGIVGSELFYSFGLFRFG